MPASRNRRYLPEVDHIRAFAALTVFLYHCLHVLSVKIRYHAEFDSRYWDPKFWPHTRNPLLAFIVEGHTGVGLFIVLSGFILSVGCINNVIDYKKFLIARILRIYPLYILLLIFGVYAYPDLFSLSGLFQSLLPLHNLPGAAAGGDLVSMFWAVSVEFQCYLIFPFLIRFADASGNLFLVRVILIAIILRCVLFLGGQTRGT